MCIEDITAFRCPRWSELPDIELYMDQVLNVLEKYLAVFTTEDEKLITASMINNYVKQKVVSPPKNKRYGRLHLAYLFVVCILKRIMSISEICESIEMIIKVYTLEEAYNLFCDIFEKAIADTFFGKQNHNGQSNREHENNELYHIISAATYAYANLLLARALMEKNRAVEWRVESGKL